MCQLLYSSHFSWEWKWNPDSKQTRTALSTYIAHHCRDKQPRLCSLELNLEAVFLCICRFFSKHTFTDLFSDLGLHLLHLKQRFLPVAFRSSALCAVHDESCETQHAIRQWQPTMEQWSSKCVWDSERWLIGCVCVPISGLKGLFLSKTLAWTGISPAMKKKGFLWSSESRFNQGCVQKCTLIENVTPSLPTQHVPCTHNYTRYAEERAHRWSHHQEERWWLCAFRGDEASAESCLRPLNFVYLLHIRSIHCHSRCTFITQGTTYPQCTAAAARSTPRWTPQWPAHYPRAALWQWCDESSPLGPGKRGRTYKCPHEWTNSEEQNLSLSERQFGMIKSSHGEAIRDGWHFKTAFKSL